MIKPDRDIKNTERRYQHLPVFKNTTNRSFTCLWNIFTNL